MTNIKKGSESFRFNSKVERRWVTGAYCPHSYPTSLKICTLSLSEACCSSAGCFWEKGSILFKFLLSNNLLSVGKCGLTHFCLNHSTNINNRSVIGTGNHQWRGCNFWAMGVTIKWKHLSINHFMVGFQMWSYSFTNSTRASIKSLFAK